MPEVVEVAFKSGCKVYSFDPNGLELNVADQSAILDAIYAYVYHNRAFLDPVALYHLRPADRRDQYIG